MVQEFNTWFLGFSPNDYACNHKMSLAYERFTPIEVKISSFKERSQEIKDKYNHKF